MRLPDRYKFADAACIARQAQGRADASCDTLIPGAQANLFRSAVSFLCFVSFLSRERKEMKALKSLCAEREKCEAPQGAFREAESPRAEGAPSRAAG